MLSALGALTGWGFIGVGGGAAGLGVAIDAASRGNQSFVVP